MTYFAIKTEDGKYLSFEYYDSYSDSGYWVEKEDLNATNGKYILFEDLQDAFNLWDEFSKGLKEPINEFAGVNKKELENSKIVELEAKLQYKELKVFE